MLFRKKKEGRDKEHLVAQEFCQQQGIDSEENFAPVANFTMIRILLALSCENDWGVEGRNVKTAFLNGTLEETIYMEVPEGVVMQANGNTPSYRLPMACRLIKAIYRLKQSPRAWYSRIHTFFQAHNFTRSPHDHSLYVYYGK